MYKYDIYFRTPFTKEKYIVIAESYRKAFINFKYNVINKRFPISITIDSVLVYDENNNFIRKEKINN